MKRLYILRHAQAMPAATAGDHARDLTPAGHDQAIQLGKIMRQRGYAPDIVLCSDALRTRATLTGLSLATDAIHYSRDIYHAGLNDLMTMLCGIEDRFGAALLIGHNPVAHELAVTLADDSSAEFLDRLAVSYPPATLTVYECPVEKWSALRQTKNFIMDVITP